MLVFDTETTGLIENMSTRSDRQPEVIEFCGITIDPYNGKVYDIYDLLIKPVHRVTEEITKINGITQTMVEKCATFEMVATHIRDLIERSDCVVAHNAAFDRDMIDTEFHKLGMSKIAWPPIICTVEATLHWFGYRLTLSQLYSELFNEVHTKAHRAKGDVEALCRIVVELRKRNEI